MKSALLFILFCSGILFANGQNRLFRNAFIGAGAGYTRFEGSIEWEHRAPVLSISAYLPFASRQSFTAGYIHSLNSHKDMGIFTTGNNIKEYQIKESYQGLVFNYQLHFMNTLDGFSIYLQTGASFLIYNSYSFMPDDGVIDRQTLSQYNSKFSSFTPLFNLGGGMQFTRNRHHFFADATGMIAPYFSAGPITLGYRYKLRR